ncbi:MAG: hypothetical protein IKG58_04065 [Bacilli bacterium]|nr:hypothetical protein [Bacilli bacterium]
MNNKKRLVLFSLVFIVLLLIPLNIHALNTGNFSLIADCGAFGNPNDSKSTAWLLKEIFSIVKYAGPFLLLILSSIDFMKAIIQSDQENMNKAQKKLLIRVVLVLALFFVPDFVFVILQIFDIVGNPDDPTCGIE